MRTWPRQVIMRPDVCVTQHFQMADIRRLIGAVFLRAMTCKVLGTPLNSADGHGRRVVAWEQASGDTQAQPLANNVFKPRTEQCYV